MTGKSFEGGSRWGRAAGIQPRGHEGTQNPQGRDRGEHSNARDASARWWASKEHEILVKINSQSIIPLKRHVPEDEAITKDLTDLCPRLGCPGGSRTPKSHPWRAAEGAPLPKHSRFQHFILVLFLLVPCASSSLFHLPSALVGSKGGHARLR